ncbi:MAG: TolC family protein [Candidatus Rokubacteria bacterium]|nr:TolC family protein [Candidatus Rokubacteria bacterium]
MSALRRRTLFFGAAALLLASGALAPAQEVALSEGQHIELKELVALATQRSPLLDSLDTQAQASREGANQARAWPGPSLALEAGRKTEASRSGGRYEAAFEQPLPILGKPGLRGRLFGLEAETRGASLDAARLRVTLEVIRAVYEYAANRRRAAFVAKRQKRFELLRSYLAGREFPTPQRKAESLIVQNHIHQLVAAAVQSQAAYKATLERLKTYAPLAPGAYPELVVPWLTGGGSIDATDWSARALEGNPELRVQRLAVQAAGIEAALASKEGYPEPSLLASYEQARAAETEKNYGLGLSLAFPSWNRNRSGIRSARRRKAAEERLLAFEEQRLRADLARIAVEFEAARQTAKQYPEAMLGELMAQLKEADEGFRKGQLDLLTFLELDDAVSETYERILQAQLGLAAAAAELLAATGETDPLARFGAL